MKHRQSAERVREERVRNEILEMKVTVLSGAELRKRSWAGKGSSTALS
jgi:hypothetical protein